MDYGDDIGGIHDDIDDNDNDVRNVNKDVDDGGVC